MKAVLVPATGDIRMVELPDGEDWQLPVLQKYVGGYIEVFRMGSDPAVVAVCNEEGKLQRLPYNPRATALIDKHRGLHGDFVVGDVLFTGVNEHSGETVELNETWINELTGEHDGNKEEG